jgi:hypothetical protein
MKRTYDLYIKMLFVPMRGEVLPMTAVAGSHEQKNMMNAK